MADVVREIERKYAATDDTALPDLRVRGVASAVERGTVHLDATYFDTADGRLAADGITLRRRTGGGDAGWHLKLPVEPGVRDEIREPLGDEQADAEEAGAEAADAATAAAGVPPALAALVRSRVRDRPHIPVMRLRSERRVLHLLDDAGGLLAEVAVDRVHAQRLPEGGTADWTEIETELGEAGAGAPRLLDRIEKRLTAVGLRRTSAASKLERALASTGEPDSDEAPVPDGSPGPTAGEHVLHYVRAQRDALVALDPAVRRGVPDSVHRMRVATRRLRSCLRSYRQVLDPAVTDPMRDELKWLAAELGIDRDQEVLTARLTRRLAELPDGLQPGPVRLAPVRARLHAYAATRRVPATHGAAKHALASHRTGATLTATLDSARHLALLDALDALLREHPLRRKAAAPAEEVTASAVTRDFDRLAARVGHALAVSAGPERDLALHEARKAAKRARYAAEAACPALGKRARRQAKRMTEVQELLGEHQDSVVARDALADMAREAHAAGEESFTYGLLYERERARAAECERELPGLWRSVAAASPL
ncbi:CHAD domain-containing protein [Streptomyces armeniacus]|uniref:CHAD domain-containing protein n=1 Tax=Streptomyces armeniacus TaxID=83291 RepID=A0A345XRB1_9ACTN|nr:CYTH and CHAD domain-containing protein [Streptomyces armeniacus]AXK34177.1 CHAD domain-containing protein [Streptomyces armeniacus]